MELARAQFTTLQLSARHRELVILTVAEYVECDFIAAQHRPIAVSAEVGPELQRSSHERDFETPDFSAADRALLHLTREVVQQPRVSDEIFELARRYFSDREIVEILQVTGYYWSFGRIATVLDASRRGDPGSTETNRTEQADLIAAPRSLPCRPADPGVPRPFPTRVIA
ncbi:carboxymuconolactone decarboxylase family protein [Streptomyces sp. RO-S4]|uniref:carboxymuconolactone decarboxylase family protein n=1 Tax=Streptomyces sp. RO-S4 TaxID=2902486 RepID=UPI00208E2042|nr:hypothetical protein [Streptomyces sp. RO-S4]